VRVRQAFGETRFIPGIGREVKDGEIIEVLDGDLASYLEGGWVAADKATTAAHQQLLADKAEGKPGVTVGTLKKSAAKPAAGESAAKPAAGEGEGPGEGEEKEEGAES